MPTIAVTGTITEPDGTAVAGVVVQLTPAPPDPGAAQAIGGVGIVSRPSSTQTASDGTFSINAQEGFRYTLTIEAIGFSRQFVAPSSDIRFDLLGLTPRIEKITDWSSDGATGVILTDPGTPTDYVALTIEAQSINTVRQRYKEIEIEKAATQDGAYSNVDTIELRDGINFYTEQYEGENDEWYRVRYTNSDTGDESQYSEPKLSDSDDEALVIAPDELKELYLFGADLTDDDGNPFPDRMFRHYIKSAVAWLEKELDIPITPIEIEDELHDHYADDYGSWGFFKLHQYPIVAIREVSFRYPSMDDEVIIEPEWVVLEEDGRSGQIQIVPGQGNIADVLLIPGQLMPLWSGATGRVPGVWRFDYRAGFEVGDVPDDIKDVIGMKAAIQVFNIAGDLIAGAGIANTSISIPGLSQSVGTTSSATNSGYGARIGQYEKQIKKALPGLKRYYGKRSKMVVA